MKTTIYTHESALLHETGPGHPECAARLLALKETLAPYPHKQAPAATQDQLLLAHPLSYIQALQDAIPGTGLIALDGGDTITSSDGYQAALHASGAACAAVDDVIGGETQTAFCAMRPPGHHAEPDRAMGFCLFNHIFIGARHAQIAHDVQKIAIVDFDVHHGNGTDAMARRHDGSILYISTHQYPLWPMSGLEEDNEDSVKNFTLPAGADGPALRALYEAKIFPALHAFKPDLLMISAGFDGHAADPLAGWHLHEEDFGWVTMELKKIAAAYAHGKVVSVLEGGYDLTALPACVRAHLHALSGGD